MIYFVTGGLGFIGSAFIRHALTDKSKIIVNLDKVTYAASKHALDDFQHSKNYHFIKGDIQNKKTVTKILDDFKPNYVINFAAESHVDNSISKPEQFINTNILGTFNLVECFKSYYFESSNKSNLKFLHISTDEVFGTLGKEGFFEESSPYDPSSPYSASKASSDHIINAWHRTFGLPLLITNCSNNYGPYQHTEKLIPKTIFNAINNKDIPIYGNGKQIRDWLYVEDHISAINAVINKGVIGETYNIGSNNEIENIVVVKTICKLLDALKPKASGRYKDQIRFVDDRPGHDIRYAINASKIKNKIGWQPKTDFEEGLKNTIIWFLRKYQ